VQSFEIQQEAGPVEVTGFGDGSKNFVPGLPVIGITLDLLYNAAATTGATTVLRGILNHATSKTVSIKPESTGLTLSGEFLLDSFTTKGSPDGVLTIGSVHFSVMGSVIPAWA
jgi:hypothetical protein